MRQQPGKGNLAGRRPIALGNLGQRAAGFAELATLNRAPWNEGDLCQRAGLEHPLRGAIEQVVPVLDRHDPRELLRLRQLVGGDVRKPDVADLAFVLQLHQRAHRFLEGNLGIGPMELVDVDLVHTQSLEAALAGRTKVRGAAVGVPASRSWTG